MANDSRGSHQSKQLAEALHAQGGNSNPGACVDLWLMLIIRVCEIFILLDRCCIFPMLRGLLLECGSRMFRLGEARLMSDRVEATLACNSG